MSFIVIKNDPILLDSIMSPLLHECSPIFSCSVHVWNDVHTYCFLTRPNLSPKAPRGWGAMGLQAGLNWGRNNVCVCQQLLGNKRQMTI